MENFWSRSGIATLAAMTPAVLGALVFARLAATGVDLRLPAAVLIGVSCGSMAVAVLGSRGVDAVLGGGIAAMAGVVIGLLLDAKWNSVAQVTAQIMDQHGLTRELARQQARTILGGASVWELMRDRLDIVGWAVPVFAVVAAAATPYSRLGAVLARIRPQA